MHLPSVPQVCISVLNWNGGAKTVACLEALSRLDYPAYRVLVVDNASTDDSLAQIRAAFPEQEIIAARENLGYAEGNRLALERAVHIGADLFWILNNDALVQPDTLRHLIAAYRRCGDGLYGCVPLYGSDRRMGIKTLALLPDGRPDTHNPFFRQPYGDRFPSLPDETGHTLKVTNLSGSCMMIPLSVIDHYGYLDTTLFLYGEEPDYCYRLSRQDVPIYLVPQAIVTHNPQGAHKNHSGLKGVITYYQVRNRLVLARRQRGQGALVLLAVQHLGYAFAWVALGAVQGTRALQNARFTLRGIRDALFNRMGKTYAPEDYLLST